jgi:hypothetical protein
LVENKKEQAPVSDGTTPDTCDSDESLPPLKSKHEKVNTAFALAQIIQEKAKLMRYFPSKTFSQGMQNVVTVLSGVLVETGR